MNKTTNYFISLCEIDSGIKRDPSFEAKNSTEELIAALGKEALDRAEIVFRIRKNELENAIQFFPGATSNLSIVAARPDIKLVQDYFRGLVSTLIEKLPTHLAVLGEKE